jgi:hypothetical protein
MDSVDPSPIRLWPQISGRDVLPSTLFPIGVTNVTFRAQDASGNIGRANANVTIDLGRPNLDGIIDDQGREAEELFFTDLRIMNNGTGNARNIRLDRIDLRNLIGDGTVSYDTTRSPALPFPVQDISVGASTHRIRLYFDVPHNIKKFSMEAAGSMQNVAGANSNFKILLEADVTR